MPTIHFHGTRQELRAMLHRLPRVLSGAEPDPWNVAQGLQLRIGMVLLSKIGQAFDVKARGGTGDDGIKWKPLSPTTIANRRPAPRKRFGERPRGMLTAAEDKRWRQIFGTRMHQLILRGMPEDAAKARAAQIAWTILKAQGAQTKLAVYGNRQVDILKDTGELRNSLSPGVDGQPVEGQVFEMPPGRVIVGTNKKPWHHKGVPGRLPARPLWPSDGMLPATWWRQILTAYRSGLVRALVMILDGKGAA